ncbi:MAG: hypothetical protein WCK89_17325 [bacterium]
MQRHTGQRGAALILLIGITAALAILSASLVMLVINQQGASARESKSKTSLYYAEAALNSATSALKANTSWLLPPTAGSDTILAAEMAAKYDSIVPSPPPATYAVYDNQLVVDRAITWDKGGGEPIAAPVATSFDGKVWVEVKVTYRGRTTILRQMVVSKTLSLASALAKAAVFCGAAGAAGANDNITFSGSGDAYTATFTGWPATNANGVPYIGGAPYPTAIKSAGNITGVNATNLALGSNVQSLGVQANGSVTLPGLTNHGNPSRIDGAADLYAYVGVNEQLALVNEASECLDTSKPWLATLAGAKVGLHPAALPAATVFTSESALRATVNNPFGTYNPATNTFTANRDLVWKPSDRNNLTLTLGNSGTKYNFMSLSVNAYDSSRPGNLALSGATTTNATALSVTGTLTISSTSGTNQFGSVNVVGSSTIGGSSTNMFTTALWVDGALTLNGSGITNTAAAALHVGGNLTIGTTASTNQFGPCWVVGSFNTTATSTSTNLFGPLWVDGAVTLSGKAATNATALHVGGAFTINSAITTPVITYQLGCVYVVGAVNWGGGASVQTTNYLVPTAEPGPVWIGGVFTRDGGPFNDVYGNTFVVFKVNFIPTDSGTASTVICPLLATTEMVTTSGNIDFGTMVPGGILNKPRPMTLFTVVDDIYYTQTVNWASKGQFTGLMILLEQGIDLSVGNSLKPAVVGSVQSIGGEGGVKIGGSAQVAYCQDVINAVNGVLLTSSTITETVPGTWQELSPSGQ